VSGERTPLLPSFSRRTRPPVPASSIDDLPGGFGGGDAEQSINGRPSDWLPVTTLA